MRVRKLLVCSLLLILLVACSRAKFAWQLADDVVRYETSRYFDLDSKQKDLLEKDLDLLKIKIEENEMKLFVLLTQDASAWAKDQFRSKEKFLDIRQRLEAILKSAGGKSIRVAQDTVRNLKPDQWQYFDRKMREKLKEDETKANDKNFPQETKKRWLRILDYFFGDMEKDQEKLIEKFIAENPFQHQLRIQNQYFMLDQFIKVKDQESARNEYLRKYFEAHDDLRIPEYRKVFQDHQEKLNTFAFQLLQTMNAKQTKAFLDRMHSLQEAFSEKK